MRRVFTDSTMTSPRGGGRLVRYLREWDSPRTCACRVRCVERLDLNLLYVLVALADQHSVSGAAAKLGKSQPGVSSALAKMRAFFADPLFVRAGNAMQPTPRGVELIAAARDVLARVGDGIVTAPGFDPQQSTRTVTLALSDVGEVVFLPAILKELRRVLPNAGVRSVSLPAAELPRELESGAIDLAIGYFPDLQRSNFFQQTLFSDTFASLIRADHPIAARRLRCRSGTPGSAPSSRATASSPITAPARSTSFPANRSSVARTGSMPKSSRYSRRSRRKPSAPAPNLSWLPIFRRAWRPAE